MQLLFSFDQDMRVEKTLIQTLACQLSSTLMQLLFSLDQNTRVEKTLIQTFPRQLSSTLMQLLFSFHQGQTQGATHPVQSLIPSVLHTCINGAKLEGDIILPATISGVTQIKAIYSHKPVRTWLNL